MAEGSDHDVLVIGGGPAGLTGALYLARFRRRVLVVDDGCSRAVRIPRSHNMPGYPEGVRGSELVANIRQQAEHYGVNFAVGRVASLISDAGLFVARWPGGSATARKVLLATGAADVEPRMPYLEEAVQSGALRYCPVCDGYEVIDQAVGVLADGEAGAKEALYLRNFTPQLTVFGVAAELRISESTRLKLQEAGIALAPGPVASIRQWNGRVTVRHGTGADERETVCDSLYAALGMHIRSELAEGADRDGDGYLMTDRHQRTSIEGLYAAGDVAQGLNQISVAAGGAAIAAAAMHLALGRAWA